MLLQQTQTVTVDPVRQVVLSQNTVFLPNSTLPGVDARADANYPDPVLDNPNGWKFKTISNASVVLNTQHPAAVTRVLSFSNSKLAPAVALASATVEGAGGINGGNGVVAIIARNKAYSRPGLQYGVTLAKGDYHAVNKAPFEQMSARHNPTLVFINQDAESGQGQAVNLISTDADGNNLVVGNALGTTDATRWYMSPSNAIMGNRINLHGGQVSGYARNRARASIGSATSGVLNTLRGDGNIPGAHVRGKVGPKDTLFLVNHGGISRADNRATVDVGSAQAGNIQLLHSLNGDSSIVGIAQARAAEGEAVAGAVNVAVSDNGEIYLGDYWDELSDPGNAVVASNIGRGPAQAGQINIAISPNQDAKVGGVVAATAVQGSATAGAFTLNNAQAEAETEQQVTAVTAEYTATAGNVGVGIAGERSVVTNSATAKSDTGSALAFDFATSVVSKQNSAVSSSRATTATGQAAGIAASQALGAVQADTQASGLGKTTTGNALSLGSALSGSIFNSRGVSTAGAFTTEGQSLGSAWTAAVAADSDASAASTATSTTGNAASITQGYGLGILNGKSTTVSSATTTAGSTSSTAIGVATGLIHTDSTATSSAATRDGNAESSAGALSLGGINAAARATSSSAAETGDVTANAGSTAVGLLHGDARSVANAITGCPDCVSDAISNAVSIGVVADSTAMASAASPRNPGNALANAIALGLVSRTSNGGSSRIAIGPGQAVSGGFAVSASRNTAEAAAAALLAENPLSRKAGVLDALKATSAANKVTQLSSLQSASALQQATGGLKKDLTSIGSNVTVHAFAPPTVADTKKQFIEGYQRPIPSIYNTVVQELLVQQHFIRYGINYKYNAVYALGFVSVFDQVLDGFDENDKSKIFTSYVKALGEDPAQYRSDAEKLESQAKALSGPDGLVPDASGNDLQQALAAVAAATSDGTFAYNRFFAVGLFRLLELTGAKEPAALEKLVKAVGVQPAAVNKDLLLYKGVLSKLSAAKEMMREFLDREKRKQAEREAAKAEKAASEAPAQA
eukprot:gene2157-2475_t